MHNFSDVRTHVILVDDEPHMVERVTALLTDMMARNDVAHDDLVSIIFTATDDIHCGFPALAARRMGLGDVPLLAEHFLKLVQGL